MSRFKEIWSPEYRWGMDTHPVPVLSFSRPIHGGQNANLGMLQPSEISHGAQVNDTDRRVSELRLPPLPMPSPTSCWYPQPDVQFGYSYPDPVCPIPSPPFSMPRTSSVSYSRPEPDPPDRPPLYTAAPPPYQPDIPYAPPAYPYNQPPDYSYPSNYTPFTSNITNLPQYSSPHLHDTSQNHQSYDQRTCDGRSQSIDHPKEYWEFDENWDAADSRRLSCPYLRHDPSRSSPHVSPIVPAPPPQCSPSCWRSPSPTSHCRSAAQLLLQLLPRPLICPRQLLCAAPISLEMMANC